jgi:RNA polymerase sigma-70 factor (ECF subfamily)
MAAREDSDDTTLHVARARGGDGESVEWLVERFTPLLLEQARFRLGARLAGRIAPEDVVQEVWAIVLPELARIEPRGGRSTPVLVSYLATTVLRHVNNLLRRRMASEVAGAESGAFERLDARTRGPLTRAMGAEAGTRVRAAIDALEPRARELVVLRAIEQRSNEEAAERLGLVPNTAAQAYRRALEVLRARLGPSVFDELEDG